MKQSKDNRNSLGAGESPSPFQLNLSNKKNEAAFSLNRMSMKQNNQLAVSEEPPSLPGERSYNQFNDVREQKIIRLDQVLLSAGK